MLPLASITLINTKLTKIQAFETSGREKNNTVYNCIGDAWKHLWILWGTTIYGRYFIQANKNFNGNIPRS